MDKVIGTRLDPFSIMNLFDGENGLGLPYILDLTYILNTTYENSKSMFIRSVDWFEKIKDFDKIFKKYESLKVGVSLKLAVLLLEKIELWSLMYVMIANLGFLTMIGF